AETFGFNQDLGIPGAATSTIPAAGEIGDDLAVGSTAIGQGKVLTTPLQMALIAAAIGEEGRLMEPTLRKGERTGSSQATPRSVARFVGRGMREVVKTGTGVGAAVKGVPVAGKTGTAEVGAAREFTQPWFIAFAPVEKPKMAIAVTVERTTGQGGTVAAPIAKSVLEAMLGGGV
ncbi:MAG: penicillin-binding transpeptidase domain-containing protein, partial [Thermoleophilia bacterium]